MSKEVQELFTSIAPTYDFLNHFLSLSVDKRWRDKAVAALSGTEPALILDLCAGTLDLSQKLAEKFPASGVIAADFSLAMLKAGKEKIKGDTKIFRIGADGHRLPFPEGTFDAALCAFGVRNLEDRSAAVREIRRVLKPSGLWVVLEFFRPDRAFSKLFHQTYGKHVLPRVGGALSKNRRAYEYLQNSIQEFFTVEEYEDFLRENGFEKVESVSLSGGIAHRVSARAC